MTAGTDPDDSEELELEGAAKTGVVGPYRVVRTVGSGAMAVVYEAVDERTGTTVALKVLRSKLADNSEVVSRFVREARALEHLPHPNIVRVFEHGVTEEGDAWIALERLRGVNVQALIRDEQKLRVRRAVKLARDIASALAVVHSHGVVQRDIKPENVFVVHPDTESEIAKLLDFGVARVSYLEMGEGSIRFTRTTGMLG